MIYPIYVHVGDDKHAHGIIFPDFPGCFSAADDWSEIQKMAQEAIECHMAGEVLPVPNPTPLERLTNNPEYSGGVWMMVDIQVERIDPSPQRVNISIPRFLLAQIDQYAQTHHQTRSGFLAYAAMKELAQENFLVD